MYEMFGLQSKVRKPKIEEAYGRSWCAAAAGTTAKLMIYTRMASQRKVNWMYCF